MAKVINLNQYKPQPHPLRARLRKLNVTNSILANYLGISYQYTCMLLGGSVKMPKHQEERIEELLSSLELDTTRLKSGVKA